MKKIIYLFLVHNKKNAKLLISLRSEDRPRPVSRKTSEAGAVLNFLLTFCFKTKSKSGVQGQIAPCLNNRKASIYAIMLNFSHVIIYLLYILTVLYPIGVNSQVVTGNPLLPGYFADPSVTKFGDTYYIYATTDGVKLASGEPSVWISKDFVNWFNYKLDLALPKGLNNCWAPDVFRTADGKYNYFMGNCEFGCHIYGYQSDSPMGPFKAIHNGEAIIPAETSKKDLPALDAQCLVDDDGSIYSYFGTWCTSFGGMGWAKIDPKDNHTILKTGFIPIAQIPKAFEAAYPIKRNRKYFLMYSSGDCRLSSYAVHYSVADSPEGPFLPGKNSPILVTNADGTVDGPGHHSVLKEGNDYFIVYHRHDNPHSTNGEFRQVCVDKLIFSDSVTIEKVIPTHTGISFLGKNRGTATNIAYKAKASASSYYHLISKPTAYNKNGYDYCYSPENATDDNNGTLWKAANCYSPQSLTIDLGKNQNIKRIATEFEYPTYYYQYKLEVSSDNTHWQAFSNKTNNRRCGSPMIDDNNLMARYVKLTITGTEKTGMIPAVWNLKVYNSLFEIPPYQNSESKTAPGTVPTKELLVDFDAKTLKIGTLATPIRNNGKLGGYFEQNGTLKVATIAGRKAICFDGNSYLKLSKQAPKSLNWNAPFTVSAWVYNPEIGMGECLLAWNSRDNMLQSSYAALMYGTGNFGAMAHGDGAVDLPYKTVPAKNQWHHIAVTFDGALETVYVDGKLNAQQPLSLYVEKGDILLGASGEPSENYTGYMANVQLYNRALTKSELVKLMNK